jgi:ferrous iron transport protein B
VVALLIGFLRKDVAVGMLMPLGLSVNQLFIGTALLAISFPCIASFVVLAKELGFKGLVKSASLMIGVSLIVGSLLRFLILR